MKTAIYLLASDDRESERYRLTLLVEKAKSEGWQYKIFSEIVDEKGTQPLKKDLLSRVYKKEFDTILIYRLSEWSGFTAQLSMELNELLIKGIRFFSLNENFDTFSITGKLYLQVLLTVTECEQSFDSAAKENETRTIKSVEQHFPRHNKTVRRTTEENPAGLNYLQGKNLTDVIDNSGNDTIPGMIRRNGKNPVKTETFDLVGLSEACSLTGYSRHTIYQLTSKKLIPHFKRPHGRRIFFSKLALEQWIMTGKI